MSTHERHRDTRPTPSLASAQPGTTPGPGPTDRAPARSSPGLPTPPHALGPHRPHRPTHGRAREPRLGPARDRPAGRRQRLQRSEHAPNTAACGAALPGRCCGRAGRPEPLYLRSRGVNRGSGWHDGLSGAEFEALWRPRTFRSARDPPLEVPARWARHPEGRETRSRPPCRPTGWAGGAAGRRPHTE